VTSAEATTRAAVAQRIAEALIEGFDRHYRLFRETSAAAKDRFDAADWGGIQLSVRERIRFYDDRVGESVTRLRDELEAETIDRDTWREARLDYIGRLVEHKRPELAETFFNSVVRRVLHKSYSRNEFIFVRSAVSTEYIASDPPTYRSYYPQETGLRATLATVCRDFGWTRPYADLDRDVDRVMQALLEHLGGRWPQEEPNFQVQVLSSAFYRNRAAYIVGRIVNGNDQTPFVVPVLHDHDGRLELDAILLDPETISVVFSLSQVYFLVDMDVPSGFVEFLQSLMPAKPRSELYTALGLGGQGKTLFFRDLFHHLHHSRDLLVEAPGERGQVMHVFYLPSYPYVFKVIKDVFGPAKSHITREVVKRKFALVKEADRVGRMVDALEFEDLALPYDRFAPVLLADLEALAPSMIVRDGDRLIVRHCYVERRMTPLDVYLRQATPEQLDHALREFGDAVRELADVNIFTGDMFFKNFGMNRHQRVVFYDYDEIEYLTDCVFRELPDDDPLGSEVAVTHHDVFPEEIATFLLGSPAVREAFVRHHEELLHPAFWQERQRRLADGETAEFFPYPESARFCNRYEP